MRDTTGDDYAQRLRDKEGARWKQLLDVQRPYRWNLRRLQLGNRLLRRRLQAHAATRRALPEYEI